MAELAQISEGTIDLSKLIKEAKSLSSEIGKIKTQMGASQKIVKVNTDSLSKAAKEAKSISNSLKSSNDTLRQLKMHRFDNLMNAAKALASAAMALKVAKDAIATGLQKFREGAIAGAAGGTARQRDAFGRMINAGGLNNLISTANAEAFGRASRAQGSSAFNLASILGIATPEELASGKVSGYELYSKAVVALNKHMQGLDPASRAKVYEAYKGAEVFGVDYGQFEEIASKGDMAKNYNDQLKAIQGNYGALAELGRATANLKNAFDEFYTNFLSRIAPLLTPLFNDLTKITQSASEAVTFWTSLDWEGVKTALKDGVILLFKEVVEMVRGWVKQYMPDVFTYFSENGIVGGIKKGGQAIADLGTAVLKGEKIQSLEMADAAAVAQRESLNTIPNTIQKIDKIVAKSEAMNKIPKALQNIDFKRLAKHEGFSPVWYKDTKGYDTIGHGFKKSTFYGYGLQKYLDANGELSEKNSYLAMQELGGQMLKEFLNNSKIKQYASNWDKLPAEFQNIIMDLIWNAGAGRAANSRAAQAFMRGDYEDAGVYLANNANKQSPNRLKSNMELYRAGMAGQTAVINVYVDGELKRSVTSNLGGGVVSVGTR